MGFLFDDRRRMIRKDGSLVENTQKGRSPGPRRTVLAGGRVSHLKVDKLLGGPGPVRDEYERLLENPNTLLKDLAAWFAARGQHVNLAAIRLHRNRQLERFHKVRETAQAAAAFCQAVGRSAPGGSLVEAAQGHFEMKLMEHLQRFADETRLGPEQWRAYCRTLKDAVATRRSVEEMRQAYDRCARDAAKGGATPRDVVARMREIMGV